MGAIPVPKSGTYRSESNQNRNKEKSFECLKGEKAVLRIRIRLNPDPDPGKNTKNV